MYFSLGFFFFFHSVSTNNVVIVFCSLYHACFKTVLSRLRDRGVSIEVIDPAIFTFVKQATWNSEKIHVSVTQRYVKCILSRHTISRQCMYWINFYCILPLLHKS